MRATEWSEPSLWPSPDRRQISSLPRSPKTLMEPYMPPSQARSACIEGNGTCFCFKKMDAMEIVVSQLPPRFFEQQKLSLRYTTSGKTEPPNPPKFNNKNLRLQILANSETNNPNLQRGNRPFSGTKKHPICPNPWPTFQQPGKGFTGKAGKSLTHQCQGERRGDVG